MSDKKGLIFDFDGTMAHLFVNYDFRPKKLEMHEAMKALGIEHAEDAGIFGVFQSIKEQTEADSELRNRALLLADDILTQAEMEALEGIVPVDGVVEILQRLYDEGWKLSVSTNNASCVVKKFLDNYIPDITMPVSGRVPGHPGLMKPCPDSIVNSALKMEMSPADTIMIGDNPRDWEAACNAGTSFIGMGSTGRKWFRNKELIPHVVQVHDYYELYSMFSNANL